MKKHCSICLRVPSKYSDPNQKKNISDHIILNFNGDDYHWCLRLFILLYVGHKTLGVYRGSEWIVEVQLVVKSAFSQDRGGYPFTEEEEGTKSSYGDYN